MRAALFAPNLLVLILVVHLQSAQLLAAAKTNGTREFLIEATKEAIEEGELQDRYVRFLSRYPFSKQINNATNFVQPNAAKRSRDRAYKSAYLCHSPIIGSIYKLFGDPCVRPTPTPEPISIINNTLHTYDRGWCDCTCRASCTLPECPDLPPRKDVCAVFPACDSHCDLIVRPLEGQVDIFNSSKSTEKGPVARYRGIDKLRSILKTNFEQDGKIDNYVGMLQPDMELLHTIDQKLVDDIKYIISYHKDALPNYFPSDVGRRFDWRVKDARHLGGFITGSLSALGHLFEHLQYRAHRRQRFVRSYELKGGCQCNMNCTIKASHCQMDCENKPNCNGASCVCQ